MKILKISIFVCLSLIILGQALFYKQYNWSSVETETKLIQSIDKFERACLIDALYGECRNCSNKELYAIADVIINRVNSNRYPSTICKVVQQPWQFSYLNDKDNKIENILGQKHKISSILDRKALDRIERVADDYFFSSELESKVLPSSVMHYHTKSMKNYPKWSKSGKKKLHKGLDKDFKHEYYVRVG